MKATALDANPNLLDPQERKFVDNIREHGWFGTDIFAEGDKPNFYFSTGIWVTLRFPEILIYGIKSEAAHAIIWDIVRAVQAGNPPPIGKRTDTVFARIDAVLQPVDVKHYYEHLGWSRWFYAGDDFPCLQVIWPDKANLFPWDAGHDASVLASQPDLTAGNWGRRD